MYLLRAEQAAQVPALVGKTFTVGDVSSVGDGINKWLVLHPAGQTGASAAKGSVILKVEGGKQLPALVGKTVTVGKSPAVIGSSASKWLALYPSSAAGANGAMGAGVAGAGAAGKGTIVLPLNDPTGQMQSMAGQTYVVGKAPVGHAANKWLVLHPLQGTAAKGAAMSEMPGSFLATGAAGGKSALAKGAIAGTAAGKTAAAATGGTLLTGMSLGMGPVGAFLLGAAVVAGGYVLYNRMKWSEDDVDAAHEAAVG